jgi:hypothetical protein
MIGSEAKGVQQQKTSSDALKRETAVLKSALERSG